MSLLLPLGLLGLLGVLALIVIYIIRPNYQQRYVSSTFVWRYSLKFRKNQLPVSKLNNILLFICQMLALVICALLLARPVIEYEMRGNDREAVVILDASAGMLVGEGGDTRFARAVKGAREFAEETLGKGGAVSLILADGTPEMLVSRAAADRADEVYAKLDGLLTDKNACSYGTADMQGAVTLAEEVLAVNREAKIYLYTATEYIEKNGITVVPVAASGEWNAAVLGAVAEMNRSNHYEIAVDLGCYGRTEALTVFCRVHGANGKQGALDPIGKAEFFDPSAEEKTVVFTTDDFGGEPLYSFDYLEIYVETSDSFAEDNHFYVYGGKKQTVKIQYASSSPNNYFAGVIRTVRESMKGKWNIAFTELKADEAPALSGYDFYIFEHRMPEVLPTDGLVLLVDPTTAPDGAGFRVGGSVSVNSSSTLAAGAPHALTQYTDSGRVTIAKYIQIVAADGYRELAYYNGNPMMLVKEEENAKVVVWAFDLNYSNIIAMPDFSFLIYNMFNYFIPATLESNAFEVGDTVTLHARGTELKVTGNGEEYAFDKTPARLDPLRPGTYTVTQKPMQGDALIIESFFVRIPSEESNITRQVDALPLAETVGESAFAHEDLLFYFALALVALLLAEWWLQSKKNY